MSVTWEIRQGDALERLREMPDESVDAVITDPPYGIGFMGKEWDGQAIREAAERDRATRKSLGPESPSRVARAQPRSSSAFGNEAIIAGPVRGGVDFQAWCERWASEALRVLKPGGHLLAFGGTRTYHRLVAGIEDAGFEIRDTICWLYGSGFPKSLDVSKAINKAVGAEREVVGEIPDRWTGKGQAYNRNGRDVENGLATGEPVAVTGEPATPEAERWQGWGTALKPAHEPVVVARKPLAGTVAANVLEHGTGGINVDGCRVEHRTVNGGNLADNPHLRGSIKNTGSTFGADGELTQHQGGRWPANVVLDDEAARMLDEQTGELHSGANPTRRGSDKFRTAYGDFEGQSECEPARGADSGGASRFFLTAGFSPLDEWPAPGDGSTPLEPQDPASPTAASAEPPTCASGEPATESATTPTCGPTELDSGKPQQRALYCAKASRGERNAGLEGFEAIVDRPTTMAGMKSIRQCNVCGSKAKPGGWIGGDSRPWPSCGHEDWSWVPEGYSHKGARRNVHPTVKPISLMRWLVRLFTPPGGLVLDLFAGSGTTGCAAVLEGFDFIGLEREAEYVEIAKARIAYWSDPVKAELALALAREEQERETAITEGRPVQLGLLDGETA